MWQAYQQWRAIDPATRPEISLVDGFLAGAAVAISRDTDDHWIEAVMDSNALVSAKNAVADLKNRLTTIQAELADQVPSYVPVLTLNDEGDFDLSAWATGFLEAVGPDLEVWAYVLAGKPEGGLLGLLGSHAVGPMGDAAQATAARHPESAALETARSQSWEFIPELLALLYRKRLELADAGE